MLVTPALQGKVEVQGRRIVGLVVCQPNAMFSETLSHRNKSNLAGHHLVSAPCHMCIYHTDIKLQNINTKIILIDSSYNDAIINYSYNVP